MSHRLSLHAKFAVGEICCATIAVLLVCNAAIAQDSSANQQQSGELSQSQQQQVADQIRALGSQHFAVRENASAYLIGLGSSVVPSLQKAYETTSDPEIKLRTRVLIHQMNYGDEESRIRSFLAGDEVEFEGWGVMRIIFGENKKSRDLFIQMYRSHPGMLKALTGSPRELTREMMKVAARTQTERTKLGWEPKLSDAMAMLLPATDRNVPITPSFEDSMMFIMNLHPVNKVAKDPVLGPRVKGLLSSWIRRSTLENREDVLKFGLTWDLSIVYPLALQSLEETDDVQTLSAAMVALAKYGNAIDSQNLLAFLEDNRIVADKHFVYGETIETKVCDVAAAAIAMMNRQKLENFGFSDFAVHDQYGLVYDNVGFAPTKEGQKAREKAMAKVKLLIDKTNKFEIPQIK